MTYYVKNEPGYEKVEYNRSKVRDAARRLKKSRKQPTFVALDPAVTSALVRSDPPVLIAGGHNIVFHVVDTARALPTIRAHGIGSILRTELSSR